MPEKIENGALVDAVAFQAFGSERCRVGESPVWDAGRGCFWWVDIEGETLHAADIVGRRMERLRCPGRPTAIGVAQGGGLVVAVETCVMRLNPEREQWSPLAQVDEPRAGRRLNDGKVGPDGCFWVGSMVEPSGEPGSAALFRVRPDGEVERKVEGLQASNGLAWTSDGSRMMHSDSRGPWIDAWRFDLMTGAMSHRERVADLAEDEGRPDGGAMDIEGVYWSCGVSAGRLNRFDATGLRLSSLPTPASAPTMCAFGGEDARSILLTSHRLGPASTEGAGGLFIGRVAVPGVPAFLFGEVAR